MLVLLSPAKKMDFNTTSELITSTQPVFLNQSQKIIHKLSTLSRKKIAFLMDISASLADLNYNRYQKWQIPFTLENARQAIYYFSGDVYIGFDAQSMKREDIEFGQQHIRILSGLYGILKPLDLIQPYRLEMGTGLSIARKKNLYEYWKKDVAKYITNELKETNNKIIINLASNEYFKVVDTKLVRNRIIHCSFKENKDGLLKTISLFTKQARGMMARYIVDHQITNPEQMIGFDRGGYTFYESLSNENHLCFVR